MKNVTAKLHVTLQKRAGNGYSPPSLCDMQLPRESFICLSFDVDGDGNGDGWNVGNYKKNDLMVRPMSRTPGSDQKIGDTQVDQVEVDCRSHVPATKSST